MNCVIKYLRYNLISKSWASTQLKKKLYANISTLLFYWKNVLIELFNFYSISTKNLIKQHVNNKTIIYLSAHNFQILQDILNT